MYGDKSTGAIVVSVRIEDVRVEAWLRHNVVITASSASSVRRNTLRAQEPPSATSLERTERRREKRSPGFGVPLPDAERRDAEYLDAERRVVNT